MSDFFTWMSQRNFECDASLSSLYSACSKEKLNCKHKLFANPLGRLYQNILRCTNPWFLRLIYCLIVGNHSNFRKYWFHAKQSYKRFVETILKEMNAFWKCFVFLGVAMPEKSLENSWAHCFWSLMSISSCYFT